MRKGILITVMMFGWLFGPPSDVQNAREAFLAKKYKEAADLYTAALEDYKSQHPSIHFNIGQSWMFQDSIAKATSWFGRVTNSSQQDPQMASWAWNQIGAIFASDKGQPGAGPQAFSPGSQPGSAMPAPGMPMPSQGAEGGSKIDQALQAFKDALKLDHDNDISRYNYELIKRKQQQEQQNQQNQQDEQKEEQKEEQKDKNQPQQDKNNAPKKENQGGQQGEPQDTEQMSPQEADRLLEAMNSNEKKFLQQLEKRKKHRTYNNDGPDW